MGSLSQSYKMHFVVSESFNMKFLVASQTVKEIFSNFEFGGLAHVILNASYMYKVLN